ncbi:predicted protein [Plenodomus lingam JN3]|uniref:Uncharacterized protein n=1 Tax=Leptosphaeria maculans (strain JN3 / isolate v23.1.3 / race Av1-4-5-6-7-8) TaxID=985895 RepID=E5A6W9_LEPMJ|nr:predicted protein [Plenodomus lingam JN3]CBX99364.1 predicted protein [Plenodomus lingam JN3]
MLNVDLPILWTSPKLVCGHIELTQHSLVLRLTIPSSHNCTRTSSLQEVLAMTGCFVRWDLGQASTPMRHNTPWRTR